MTAPPWGVHPACPSAASKSLGRQVARSTGRSLAKRIWYNTLHTACRLASLVLFRIRISGRENLPKTGGVLVCSNHQSHFDPVLVGLALDRRLNYLARKGLFAFAPFRWLIESLDAIPVDRDGSGLSGLKETLRRLRKGEMVLIFPEGTRSSDGRLGEIKPGFLAVARRGHTPLLPVGIDGAYQAWPRQQFLPSWGDIHLFIGEPISADAVAASSDEELIAELTRRLAASQRRAGQSRTHANA